MSELRNCWKLVIAIIVLTLCSFAVGMAALTVKPKMEELVQAYYIGCMNLGQSITQQKDHVIIQKKCQYLASGYYEALKALPK